MRIGLPVPDNDIMKTELKKITATTNELAKLFGVVPKYVSELVTLRGMPKVKHNTFNLIECVKWRFADLENIHKKECEKLKADDPTKDVARKNAELKEFQLQEIRKNLLPADKVKSDMIIFLTTIKTGVNGLGAKVGPRLKNENDVKKIIRTIDAEVNNILNRISLGV